MIGIVLHAGGPGDTMVEHIYYDEKYKIMETKANIYKFPDHVVHCLINTERKVRNSLTPILGTNFEHKKFKCKFN